MRCFPLCVPARISFTQGTPGQIRATRGEKRQKHCYRSRGRLCMLRCSGRWVSRCTKYMHIIRAVPLRPMNLTPGQRLGPPFAASEGDGSWRPSGALV
ncbi:hypothetical protein V8C42DRAFT_329701 [Trichoderma barbatum]